MKILNEGFGVGCHGAASARQYQMPGAAFDQPQRQHFAEAAKRPGDQIAAIVLDRKGWRQGFAATRNESFWKCHHDFADVFALRHEPECRVNAARGERAERQRRERTLLDQFRDLFKQLTRKLLVTAEDSVHGNHMEGSIAPQRPKRDAGVLIDVAFADLDEAAEFCQAGKPHRNRFAGERIQDDVHAAPGRQLHDSIRKISAARVNHMFDSQRFQQRALDRAPCGGDDLRAQVLRDLDGRHSHTTGARMDKDSLAGPDPRHVFERVPGGHEHDGESGGLVEREIGRDTPHVAGPREGVGGKPERRDAKHPISWRDVEDSGADRLHDAGHFITEDPGIGRLAGIQGKRLENITKIHSRRFHFDQHLVGSAEWSGKRHETQRVKMPSIAGLEPQRHIGIEPLLALRPATAKALHVSRFTAEGDFALRIVPQQVHSTARRRLKRNLRARGQSHGR